MIMILEVTVIEQEEEEEGKSMKKKTTTTAMVNQVLSKTDRLIQYYSTKIDRHIKKIISAIPVYKAGRFYQDTCVV